MRNIFLLLRVTVKMQIDAQHELHFPAMKGLIDYFWAKNSDLLPYRCISPALSSCASLEIPFPDVLRVVCRIHRADAEERRTGRPSATTLPRVLCALSGRLFPMQLRIMILMLTPPKQQVSMWSLFTVYFSCLSVY